LPIVIVTGHQDSTAIRRAFDAGATDFISKPVNWALLPHRLEYILRNAAAAEHIERLAYYDTLTGLPNRRRCVDLLGRMVAAAKGSGESVAFIYLDLNNFKRVNDTFGHAVGDDVLRTVAGRLTSTLSGFSTQYPSALVARFGGDEFIVAVRHAQAREVGLTMAAACSDAFAKPIVYDSLEFYSAPSVGMAVFPDDGADVATVLKHADTAMYQSKSGAADPIAVYAPAMSKHLEHWLELEAKLRRAIENDLLTLMFQPKFSLANNRLVGVEALVRWCDDEYGDIPPSRFVQIAEDSGLIIEMSAWVVRAACRQLRKWLDRGVWIPVAINCSGKDLLHGDPARVIETEAAAAGVPTSLIEVEITETLLVNDSSVVKSILQRIRQLGCHIALDDFGTGYSHQNRQGLRARRRSLRGRRGRCERNSVAGQEPRRDGHRRGHRTARPARLAARARLQRGARLFAVATAGAGRARTALLDAGQRTGRCPTAPGARYAARELISTT
jgi:diguanylate cyclase (GGDEF)-like protein